MIYVWTAVGLVLWFVFSWLVGTWLHPNGAGIWILRAGMALLGIAGAALTLWFLRRNASDDESAGSAPGDEDLQHLVRDALRKLKSSAVSRGSSLADIPVFFCLGDSGAAKTTTILHSSLDPELLAGQVYHDNNVIPTAVANIWYTRQAIFVDPSGSLAQQPARWKRLVHLLKPIGLTGAMRKRQQAPRAAVVCVDCESFLKPGAREATLSTARRLGSRLHEMSQSLGVSFPIYVMFTRADRIGVRPDGSSLFLDFVAGLSRDETLQVLGATLPVRSLTSGVYAEEEDRRLGKAFDELFYSLAERRSELLARSNEPTKAPGIYEFPRELRKLRTLLVQFLIDLARPSHININPFLRGFYFTGVRPVMINDVAPAQNVVRAPEPQFDSGATRIFNAPTAAQAPAPARMATSRKVPEWVFLTQFFNDVLLKDRLALSASSVSVRTNLARRLIFATIGAFAAILVLVFSVSFIGNWSLIRGVRQAADDVKVMHVVPGQSPTVDQLQTLDRLRQQLDVVSTYHQEGTPFRLRSFLYVGDSIYQPARQIYFARFRELLFDDTQGRLRLALRNLKDAPDTNDSYESPYNQLRAYLITTINPEKSTRDFLSPVLYDTWSAGRTLDASVSALARTQFDFYSTELQRANPYDIPSDDAIVAHARLYLQKFSGIDRYYVPLLTAAGQKNPDVSFLTSFKDAVGIVDDGRYVVRGAFTRGGFAFMQEAIRKPSNLRSEEWVLGPATASQFDPAALQQKITETYYDDYVRQWRAVLEHAHILVSQGDATSAAKKLETLTGPTSPILELMWFVSHNTDVGVPSIVEVFAPVHSVMPPGPSDRLPDRYINGPNTSYINALGTLAANINTLAKSPAGATDLALANSTTASAEAARQAARQLTVGSIDQRFHTERLVGSLLEEPIISAQKALSGNSKAPLNDAGKALCHQFDAAKAYFPFNPNGADLPIDQLNALLAPGTDDSAGALWKLYNKNWAPFLTRVGSQYQANTTGAVKITPEFVGFFNRIAALSGALYSTGAHTPQFSYTLQQLPSNVDGLALKIGNDSLNSTGQRKNFTWTGSNDLVQATAKGNLLGTAYPGSWAIFRFVSNANWSAQGPTAYNLEWVMQANGRDIIMPNGKKQSYSYQVQVAGFNPLKPSAMAGMRCVSQVTR